MTRTWWLNLDAERELAEPSARATPARLLEQIAARARHFAPSLCRDDPYVLPDCRQRCAGAPGPLLIWCPTPGALRAACAAGYRPPKAPTLAVLQRVNDRRFAWELARSAPLRALVERLESSFPASAEFEASRRFCATGTENADGALAGPVRLKRRYGFAGKGQRRVEEWPLRTPDQDTERWLRGAVSGGGFLLEPDVDLQLEVSTHGLVTEGQLIVGAPCRQLCDAFGAPLSVERVDPEALPHPVYETTQDTARVVGLALREVGYFGPFGVDSRIFLWRGRPGVHLVGDLNGRFMMGWSTGMARRREAALAVLLDRTDPGPR